MWHEPTTIRVKDLQPGDRFKFGNVDFEVTKIEAQRIWYGTTRVQPNKKVYGTESFGLKCQARVELIEP